MLECKFCTDGFMGIWRGGINRYMLECKLYKDKTTLKDVQELIDTCWNVN